VAGEFVKVNDNRAWSVFFFTFTPIQISFQSVLSRSYSNMTSHDTELPLLIN